MLLEICIPGLTALLACVYYNRDELKGEKDVEGRRFPQKKLKQKDDAYKNI